MAGLMLAIDKHAFSTINCSVSCGYTKDLAKTRTILTLFGLGSGKAYDLLTQQDGDHDYVCINKDQIEYGILLFLHPPAKIIIICALNSITMDPSIMEQRWDELRDPKRVWVGEPGSREEGLGRLVLLTPERVANAAQSQIRPCELKMVPLLGGVAFDDIYVMNPQQSSQWDGLRHFSMPREDGSAERVFYGGTTKEEILDRSNDRIGIHHWAQEGITGRGVLIDYASWAEKRGIKYTTFSQHTIKLVEILEIAKECNITFQRGDILLVRIGVIKEWEHEMDVAAKQAYAVSTSPKHAGVEGTMDMLKWVWNTGFAAVAGDAISWEVYPPLEGTILMHEYMLAGWGMPIGELFDLERLAETCKQLNRWTFFMVSSPFNMKGGISSPPNAQAIF
ncbi:hypothetical protein FPSE_05342 [Fusarium pseudograminearum CS3096]|uniref:Cyclase n=1 Tax=Fusarium pseudograminearum (strain CS3096) TaxID=1028729 RepID=K3VIY6_FUSPC|nr:hypothetical protein FPSE_05342 [Fusarium pseudograminearum CS3096]EKJ74592.1 hypothetical protein FPSE_05342 [Fusarium pseudograminearum CS3096]